MSAQGPLRHGEPAGFDLIETLRWEPAAGFLRLDRHLARLATSARELGFDFSPAEIHRQLATIAAGDAPLRVRLTLEPSGKADVTAYPFTPLAPDTVWRLGIARTRLDAGNGLLRHKTTLRQAYETARAEFTGAQADEVILLNQRGEVCEGTITTVFVDMGVGPLHTPPLDCGLLAGVLRAEMLETGKAIEAVLTPEDLRQAARLFVGNSLRGLIAARLV
jgi:4-amino-4-deoxychorismate lyase